ncbi:MAG: PrsW family glutamic-type intramembrane protease [Pyrinomonadaceae bacterium]
MKLLLTIESGSLAGRNYELTKGFLTVGRSEKCAVRFDPLTERIASKQHAYIEAKADGFYLVDNKSSNGTFVNNQKIQIVKLNSGDVIQFGREGIQATINLENNQYESAETQIKPPIQIPANYQNSPANQIAASPETNWRNSISNLGLGHIETQSKPGQTGKYIGVAVALFSIVFLSLIVILITVASVGIGAAFLAAVIAFVPACIYLLPLVWLDRYDPEPLWLLALAFAWGALVSVVIAFVINTVIGAILGDAVGAVVSAPIFEEGSKGLGLVILLIFFRRYFDDILDGIIFAGVIALGFATVENVLYYGRGIVQGGSNALIVLFVLRGIMSPFAHVTFTSMTGIGCGISRESYKPIVRIIMPIMGYGGAIFLHAVWNGLATIGGLGGFIVGYVILEIPFFLIFVGFAFYTMHRQNKILKNMLAIDVARGLIPNEHLEIATSAFRSSTWLLGSLFNGKFKARNQYLRAVGKLGLTYWHIQRATAAQGQTGSFQQNPILRDEVLKWRERV